jgi:thiamine-monophosphate kinase
MKLSDLGEKNIIRELSKIIDVGDDAACIPLDGRFLVASTDMMYRKTDILNEMSYRQIGKKIVTINLSDVASMGADPFGFLLSYGSQDIEVENFNEIISGAFEQCSKYNVKFLGGDTNETDDLTLAGTALGFADKPILRSGAKAGDVVAVTDFLGTCALGVDILIKNLRDFNEIDREILAETLETEPKVYEGKFLKNYANAMTDISDSLAVSLHDIADASNVRIELDSGKIPLLGKALETSKELNLNLLNYALYGGGDYELLFTASKENWVKIKNLESEFNFRFTKIGEVVSGSGVDDKGGGEIERRGYEHFSKI